LWAETKTLLFYSKNKFEKLVHLVGFIIRIYHDARSPERLTSQDCCLSSCSMLCSLKYEGHIVDHKVTLEKLTFDSATLLSKR